MPSVTAISATFSGSSGAYAADLSLKIGLAEPPMLGGLSYLHVCPVWDRVFPLTRLETSLFSVGSLQLTVNISYSTLCGFLGSVS